MRRCLLLNLAILLIGAVHAPAQTIHPKNGQHPRDGSGEGRYVPFPFDPNVEGRLLDQLKLLKQLEPYRDLFEKIMRDPEKFNLNPDAVKQLKLEDPSLQQTIKKLVEPDADGKVLATREKRDQLKQAVQKILKERKDLVEKKGFAAPEPEAGPANPAPAGDGETSVRKWLKDAMTRAEKSDLGERLRKSEAWQKAFANLAQSMHMPDVKSDGWGLDRLMHRLDKLPLPDATTLERLEKFRPTNLPEWRPPLPSLTRPDFSPSAPALPTTSSLGTLAVWLLCLGLTALALWQASRWLNLTGPARSAEAARLGPWPVDPGLVSTRSELVQAFDYLAVLTLGPKARVWHHRAVGRALAGRAAPQANAALRLADLYEQARYTEGAETLGADDRDEARRALTQLARVVAA
jgi:hypothetical protein